LFVEVAGDYLGMITGSYEVPNEDWLAPDFISAPVLTATMPVYLMTVAESELLLAEAYLRLGDVANAKLHYDAGVHSSFMRMGASDTLKTTTGGVYEFPASGFEAQLEAIIVQKWVDAADGQRGAESFIEWVRTGYPQTVSPAIQAEIVRGYEADLPVGYIPGTLIYSVKGSTGVIFLYACHTPTLNLIITAMLPLIRI